MAVANSPEKKTLVLGPPVWFKTSGQTKMHNASSPVDTIVH